MKKILNIIFCLMILFVCLLAGCSFFSNSNDNNSDNNSNNNSSSGNTEPKLLATLDSTVIKSYGSGFELFADEFGTVTINLEGSSITAGFSWDLSNYSFKPMKKYLLIFNNLSFTGFDYQIHPTLRTLWSDSSYNYLRYYNTDTWYFHTWLDNEYLRLNFDSLTYETYSFPFMFNHNGVTDSDYKYLYCDFSGIEQNGTISFDSLSIYG